MEPKIRIFSFRSQRTVFSEEKKHSYWNSKYTEEDIIKMVKFLVDNIFVVFVRKLFKHIVWIPMGTRCVPLLADMHMVIHTFSRLHILSLLPTGKKQLAFWTVYWTPRYIDYALSIHCQDFENYIDQMFPTDLQFKYTIERNTCLRFAPINRVGQSTEEKKRKRSD